MQAGEESRKNKQLLLSSWHKANIGDSKCLLIQRPAHFQVTSWQQVLISGPFKLSSDGDTNINSLEDLLAIFQYCKGSLTQKRDTEGDNQKKVFAEYSQIAKGTDRWQGCWDKRKPSSPCSHTLWHSWEERKPQKVKAVRDDCYLGLSPRATPVAASFYRSTGLPRLAIWPLEEEVQCHSEQGPLQNRGNLRQNTPWSKFSD